MLTVTHNSHGNLSKPCAGYLKLNFPGINSGHKQFMTFSSTNMNTDFQQDFQNTTLKKLIRLSINKNFSFKIHLGK